MWESSFDLDSFYLFLLEASLVVYPGDANESYEVSPAMTLRLLLQHCTDWMSQVDINADTSGKSLCFFFIFECEYILYSVSILFRILFALDRSWKCFL